MPEYNLDDYKEYEFENAKIYLDKQTKSEDQSLKIGLAKLFIWKKLSLEGAEIIE